MEVRPKLVSTLNNVKGKVYNVYVRVVTLYVLNKETAALEAGRPRAKSSKF